MAREVVRMRDMQFDPELFRNYMSGTVLDELLCSYKGLPKGVNYMIIGDPGVECQKLFGHILKSS